MAEMLYQGHGSYRFALDGGTVVYVDPFAGEGYDMPADLVLVTHEHADHNQVDKMPHAEGCSIVRAKDVLPAPGDYRSIDAEQITKILKTLHKHGILVVIDGFGSGSDSIGFLKSTPVDAVSIDVRFVRGYAL